MSESSTRQSTEVGTTDTNPTTDDGNVTYDGSDDIREIRRPPSLQFPDNFESIGDGGDQRRFTATYHSNTENYNVQCETIGSQGPALMDGKNSMYKSKKDGTTAKKRTFVGFEDDRYSGGPKVAYKVVNTESDQKGNSAADSKSKSNFTSSGTGSNTKQETKEDNKRYKKPEDRDAHLYGPDGNFDTTGSYLRGFGWADREQLAKVWNESAIGKNNGSSYGNIHLGPNNPK